MSKNTQLYRDIRINYLICNILHTHMILNNFNAKVASRSVNAPCTRVGVGGRVANLLWCCLE